MNCCVAPFAVDELTGDIEIEVRTAGVTVSTVAPLTDPSVAVMVVVPAATPVALPSVPIALLMVAIAVLDEVHITLAVRS